MNSKIFSLAAFFSAAFLMASALSIPAGSAHAFGGSTSSSSVTESDCNSGWNSSPANQTCELNNTNVVSNKCDFYATCTYKIGSGDDRGDATITGVSKGDASNVHHCGRLTLQVGSC